MKYSPTPWNVRIAITQDGQGGFTVLSLIGSDGRTIAEKRIQGPSREEDEANFQIIAQEVNAHERLVAALDQIARLFKDGEKDDEGIAFQMTCEDGISTVNLLIGLARETLSKAGL